MPAFTWHDCRLLVESVADRAIFMLDAEGCVATWNCGAQAVHGYAVDEILGVHCSALFTPEDAAEGKPSAWLAEARKNARLEGESWRVRKDGSRFWASVITTPLFDDAGELRGYTEVTRDLTESRRAEQCLRRAEEQVQQLLDAVSDCALFRLEVSGHVASWNAGATRLLGYQAEEIIGRSFELFFVQESRDAGEPQAALHQAQREARFEKQQWYLRKGGERFCGNLTLSAQRDEQGGLSGYACVARDLTEQRRVEEVQRKLTLEKAARGAAEDVNRLKDEFLMTACKELKLPLNAIAEWATLLKAQPSSSVTAKSVDVIHQSVETQRSIIEDILSVSRIMTGKLKLELNLVDAAITLDTAYRVNRRDPSGT